MRTASRLRCPWQRTALVPPDTSLLAFEQTAAAGRLRAGQLSLLSLWGEPGIPSPLGGGVSVDAKEPTRYSVAFGAGGVGHGVISSWW